MDDEERKKKRSEPLPESSDKEFWGEDAESYISINEKIPLRSKHEFKQRGTQAVCISCPFEHGIYLDNEEVREGKIVKILHPLPRGQMGSE